MTSGRMICGIGRGTVPREAQPLGTRVGWNNDRDDLFNREVFEEQVAIIKRAWQQETISFHGKHYELPPAGIDDRGRTVETLTLIPKPFEPQTPVVIWQPVTSPPTADCAARERHKAVFWFHNRNGLKRAWQRYAELVERYHGVRLRRGEDRQLVVNLPIGASGEAAMAETRPGHDEFWRFLGPYGFGTSDDVGDQLVELRDAPGLEYLSLFPHFPGVVREQVIEQLERSADDIRPGLLGSALSAARA